MGIEFGKLDLSSLTHKIEDKDKTPCGGLVYRYNENTFMNSNGELIYKQSFKPLRKKSCKRNECEKCSYMLEDLRERNYEFTWDKSIEHNDICKLSVTNVSRDWETGYIDDWDLEMIKINE